MLLFVSLACLLAHPAQPVSPPKLKAPVPPPHTTPDPGEKPVTPATAKPPPSTTPAEESDDASPVTFPHPLITEVLYAVPGGEKGDANRDGTRHAAGDEFVELVNPHAKAIQLYGYTITDRNPPKKGQLKFTFPAFELPPHGVVVVFNGCEQGWGKGEQGVTIVGDQKRPPRATNPNFHNAYVFTAGVESSRTSWSNAGDYVLLSDPAGNPVECVHWGEFSEPVPAATLTEAAPLTSKCSVQRPTMGGGFKQHADLRVPRSVNGQTSDEAPAAPGGAGNGDANGKKPSDTGVVFSPGWFDLPRLGLPAKPRKPDPNPTSPDSPTSPKTAPPEKPNGPAGTPTPPKRGKP